MDKTKQKNCAAYCADLDKALAQTSACKAEHCCLDGKAGCKALSPLAATAGFVAPGDSTDSCGYCVPAYRGFVCFCPTRWALFRGEASSA